MVLFVYLKTDIVQRLDTIDQTLELLAIHSLKSCRLARGEFYFLIRSIVIILPRSHNS